MYDINTITTSIKAAIEITSRLKKISKNTENAEFKNLLADLQNNLADTKLEVIELKNRIYKLEQENLLLKDKNNRLEKQSKESSLEDSETTLSKHATDILQKCKKIDSTTFNDLVMCKLLSSSLARLEFDAGLSELLEKELILQSTVDFGDGASYSLTPEGKRYLITNI